jgi:CheY-like chemotaxis protein
VRNRRLQADLTSERDHQEEIIEQQLRELEKARVASAIAQATQMLAHDVRKPFSMLRMTLERLANAKSADQIQKLANIALPDIRNALDQADSLVRDVLEVSTKSRLDRKNLAPTDLVMRTVRDLKKHHPNVSVSTHIKSSHPVWGDETRIQRVLENILTNAVEATGEAGDIEISVLDQNGSSGDVIFFSIWNSGPAIDAVDADRLFDPFFTKGKTGGKGLGLAIAQKFVLEHDGKIWCESSVRGGVSFCFELPASDIATPQPDSNNEVETELLAKVHRAFHGVERPSSILVVDDEQLYRSGFEAMIGETEVASHLTLSFASSAADARRIWKETSPDLVVLDIDLGTSSISGLQLLAEMRGAGDTTFVCVHSNRPVEANSELDAASHRTCVLPKPISHQQLFSLLLTVLETSKTPTDECEAPASESSRRFAFLDDSLTARALWRDAWPEGVLETFATPEEFWKRANGDAAFLSGLAAVFTDIRFNGTSPLDGHEFAASLRGQFQGPIYLATDAIAQHPAATEGITGVISKEVPTRAMLAAIGH